MSTTKRDPVKPSVAGRKSKRTSPHQSAKRPNRLKTNIAGARERVNQSPPR